MIRVLSLLWLVPALVGCRSSDPRILEVKIVPDAAQRVSEAFSPNPAVVPAGGMVIWINRDHVAHAVEGESRDGPCAFHSEEIAPGKSFRRLFSQPARCRYICRLHGPAMQGTLTVGGAEESRP